MNACYAWWLLAAICALVATLAGLLLGRQLVRYRTALARIADDDGWLAVTPAAFARMVLEGKDVV